MGCPSSTANGCRCPEHDPGLSVYAQDPEAYARALAPLRGPTRLSIVTAGPFVEQICSGGMLCGCPACAATRASIVARGAQGEGNASPFKVRHAA